jgi:hypothetical protein
VSNVHAVRLVAALNVLLEIAGALPLVAELVAVVLLFKNFKYFYKLPIIAVLSLFVAVCH